MRCRTLLACLVLVALAGAAQAAEWQTLRPGESTQDDVRAQLGQPTRVTSQQVEGYDSPRWLYEGAQAPRGIAKVTIDFGLLSPQGYKASLIRVIQVEPRPGVFLRETVLAGWGEPDGVKTENGVPSILYQSGLIVTFDKAGKVATLLVFTPPQKPPPSPPTR
jgi:outer membrane protein assembly factor BamE (lipoprotein component of BamABCDE complex)